MVWNGDRTQTVENGFEILICSLITSLKRGANEKTKPPARSLRSHRRLFLFLPTAVCLGPSAFLCSRWKYSLQRDTKIECQIRLHVVVRLITTGRSQRIAAHDHLRAARRLVRSRARTNTGNRVARRSALGRVGCRRHECVRVRRYL